MPKGQEQSLTSAEGVQKGLVGGSKNEVEDGVRKEGNYLRAREKY